MKILAGLLIGAVGVAACGSSDNPATSDGALDAPASDAGTADLAANELAPTADLAGAERPAGGDAGLTAGSRLMGAWYSRRPATDAGVARDERWRFEGRTYFLVVDSEDSYCAETGSFALTETAVRFQPDHVEGFGSCQERAPFTATITWAVSGFSLSTGGGSVSYAPIRDVRKVFFTTETHDGDLAGDRTLPGANVIQKADAICNRSLAKPDGGRYRAFLVDDVNRKPPATDWVLAPRTTYFSSDGSRNLFTTERDRVAPDRHDLLALAHGWVRGYWSGLGGTVASGTCRGWSSNDAEVRGNAGAFRVPEPGYGSLACDTLDHPFLCVGEGRTLAELAGPAAGGADGGLGLAALQGHWFTTEEIRTLDQPQSDFERLRFEGEDYFLISDTRDRYCLEFGKVQAVAGGFRFLPERVDGQGWCRLREVRTATIEASSAQLLVTSGGTTVTWKRTPVVRKAFPTIETHVGDFAGDGSLPGATAVAKADAFCNQSEARPDGQTYRAVLVDGVNRNLQPAIDWVLAASADYYYPDGTKIMFQTDAQGRQLTTSSFLRGGDDGGYYWVGLDSPGVASMENCRGWTSASPDLLGRTAWWSGAFISNFASYCSTPERLICVSR